MAIFDDLIPDTGNAKDNGLFGDLVPKKTGVLEDIADTGRAIVEGAQGTYRAARAAVGAAVGADQDVLQQAAAAKQAQQTSEVDQLGALKRDIQARAQANDTGLVAGVRNVAGAIADNPTGAVQLVAEQAPNSAVALGAGYLGAKGGAAIGTMIAPGVGTVIGGVGGFLAGLFGANTLLETGGKVLDKAADGSFSPEDRSQALQEGVVKGAVITGVDAATLGASKFLLGAAGRAVEDATIRTLTNAGIDAAKAAANVKAAQQAALKSTAGAGEKATAEAVQKATAEAMAREGLLDPAVQASVQAAQKTAFEATMTAPKRLGRGAAAVGLESAGEGVGEYTGELAATGKASPTEAMLEAVAGLSQSLPELYVAKQLNAPGTLTDGFARQRAGTPPPAAAPDNLADLTAEAERAVSDLSRAVDPWVTAGSVLQAPTLDAAIEAAQAASVVADVAAPRLDLAARRAMVDRNAELLAQAESAGTEFERQQANEQAATALPQPAPGRASDYVDLAPMDPRQAQQRLAVLRDEIANAGGNALELAIVPHPSQKGALAIGRRALPDLELSTPTQDVAPAAAQSRIESAALAGAVDQRRAEDQLSRQVVIDRALRNVEERGGVASPAEARLFQEAGLGQPYNRIDESLAPTLPDDQQLTQATGIAVGRAPRSSAAQQTGPTEQDLLQAESQARSDSRMAALAAERAARAAGQQTPASQPAAPAAGDVIQALVVPGRERTAEQVATINQAQARYSAEDFSILQRAASAPFRLSTQERIRLRELRQAPAQAADTAAPQTSQTAPSRTGPDLAANATVAAALTPQPRLADLRRQAELDEANAIVDRALGKTSPDTPLPRPGRVGGVPASQLTDEQLRKTAGDSALPAVTRRGAQIELLAREQERLTNPPADPAQERLEAAAQQGRLAQPSNGRIIVTGAKLSTQRLTPGATLQISESEVDESGARATAQHDVRVVDPGRLGVTGKLLQQVARVFGKRLVVFESDSLAADGFVRDGDSENIFVNASSQISPLAVFGHELTHLLKQDNPEAYRALEAVVRAQRTAQGEKDFAAEYGESDRLLEELTSDLVGNRFQEADFWLEVFNEIRAQNPENAQSIIGRLAAALQKAINAVVRVIRQPGFNADRYVSDLLTVKTAVKQALVQYAQSQRVSAMQMEAEVGRAREQLDLTAGRKPFAYSPEMQGQKEPERGVPLVGTGERVLASPVRPANAAPDDLRRSVGDARVSPRAPTGVKATESPLGPYRLQPDLASAQRDQTAFAHNINLMAQYPNFEGVQGGTAEMAETMIGQMKDNLLWLFNHWKPEFRERSRLWYVGGNRIAHRWAKRFNTTPDRVAAVIAATSPQKDWFQNVSLAERILEAVVNNSTKKWDARMSDTVRARDWGGKASRDLGYVPRDELGRLEGKSLRDLYNPADPASLLDMAVWVRAWDEAYNPMMARVITPEGSFTNEFDAKRDGTPIGLRWQSFATISKTLQILAASDRAAMSEIIGANHKVRSFFNNIIAPFDDEDVTIDTHAVAASLLRPLGSSDTEVAHNFGTNEKGQPGPKNSTLTGLFGTYAIYAEAYRRAAREMGVLPREMQSITWEAVRGLFRPEQKRAGLKSQIDDIWRDVATGAKDVQEAREEISRLVGGITDPAWVRSPSGRNEAARDSSYQGELAEAGVPGGGARSDAGRSPGRDPARVKLSPQRASDEQTAYDRVRDRLADGRGLDDAGLLEFLAGRERRASNRPGFIVDRQASPGLATAYWRGRLAGGNGFFTAARYGQDPEGRETFLMGLFPAAEIDDGSLDDVRSAFDRRAYAWYLAARKTDTGAWEVATDGAEPGTPYHDQLIASGELEDAGNGYTRFSPPEGTTANDLLREGARRLSLLLGGQTPDLVFSRQTGARPRKDLTVLSSERVEARFSRQRQVDTPEFKRWFGESKVVDAEGKPLVVYHGMPVELEGGAFRPSSYGTLGEGIYFTSNPEAAGAFATGVRGLNKDGQAPQPQGNTVPAYLKLEQPFDDAFFVGNRQWQDWALSIVLNGRPKDASELDIEDALYQQYVGREDRKTALELIAKLKAGNATLRDVLFFGGRDSEAPWGKRITEAVRSHGAFDGFILTDSPKGFDEYVVFEPTQIKSAIGNNGAFDPASPVITASRRRTPLGFYSALADGIDGIKTNAAPAAGWKDAIKGLVNKGQVKADEVEWTGINDWLNLQQGRVTKDQVSEYLRQGGVQVEETVLGATEDAATALNRELADTGYTVEADSIDDDVVYIDPNGEAVSYADLPENVRAIVDRQSGQVQGPAKFKQYTLPGGENYREVLLTLPTQDQRVAAAVERARLTDEEAARYRELESLSRRNEASDDELAELSRLEARREESQQAYAKARAADGRPDYTSTHWAQRNVLAHIRLTDRTDADGNKVLFVEELQSDWGQQGKKEGFGVRQKMSDAEYARLEEEHDALMAIPRAQRTAEQQARYAELQHLTSVNAGKAGVPAAPFVTNTEGWLNLALKRVMVMAAEGGYDKVAFVNGEQSAERYDLSKQVSRIVWNPETGNLYATPRAGEERIERSGITAEKLPDIIGKEAAERLVSEKARAPNGTHVLKDGDLKVGGEGMKAFYDSIVPLALKKLLPKVGGQKLAPIELQPSGKYQMRLDNGESRIFDSEDSAYSWMARSGGGGELTLLDGLTQPGFDITPAMREKVAEGLPLFSRRRRNIFGQAAPLATWTAPTETKLDDWIYKLQDKQVDTKRVVQAIKDAVGSLDEKWNAYLQEELYHGRTAKQTKDFLGDELRPLMQDMQARGVGMADFEEYLHNRHAEERNRQIAKINPRFPDGGSGIDTADARRYLSTLAPAKRRSMEALASRIDTITAGTRKLLLDSGLETPETIAAWESAYGSYVPLFREDLDFAHTDASGLGTGQGYQVRGTASKRATGSSRPVVDILANVVMQRERAIVRAEKTRVAQAIYGLAVSNPNTDFWLAVDPAGQKDPARAMADLMAMGLSPADAKNIIEEPVEPHVDPRTGLVSYRPNALLRNSPNVLAVRINGVDRYVFFNANSERSLRMAQALKNLDADQLGQVMSMAAKATRYFASINTQYNPIFGVVNMLRDTEGALVNLSTTPIADRKTEVLGNAIPALRGIYASLRADRDGRTVQSKWADLWEEFQREGGQTGYRDMYSNSQARAEALQRELDPSSWADSKLGKIFTVDGRLRVPLEAARKVAWAPVFDWLSDYNESMENAVRLAAYKAAKDKGLSNAQAASVAKNLTVNFNRKGQVGVQAGALYAFFNASVQGTARLVETLRGPAGQRIIAGGLLLGSAQAALLAAAGFDEDEPPDFVKERNLIIPTGNGKYLQIPMPLGLNVIPNTGRNITEYFLHGRRDPAKYLGRITGAFFEMFNPIGNAGWSAQTITPTLADPFVALTENRDYTGKPIAKEDSSSLNPTPGYTRAKETASAVSKWLAYYLNLASGGTPYKPGVLSPTPDQLDYLIGQATGGVGRELMKVEQTITSSVTGEELPPYKVPLAGRFYGDTKAGASESNRFYENITRLNKHEAEIKGRRKDGKPVEDYLRANPEARLFQAANTVERDIQELRKKKRDLLGRDAPKAEIERIEKRITDRMRQLNDRVRQTRDQRREALAQ